MIKLLSVLFQRERPRPRTPMERKRVYGPTRCWGSARVGQAVDWATLKMTAWPVAQGKNSQSIK